VNELEYIRSQVALEHRHLLAVARACAEAFSGPEAPPDAFLKACAEYLVRSGRRWLARVRAASQPTDSPADASTRKSGDARTAPEIADPATCEGSLAELERAMRAGTDGTDPARLAAACRACAHVLASALSLPQCGLSRADTWTAAQWRRFASVDADSILEERAAWEAIVRALPAGVRLEDGCVPADGSGNEGARRA